MKSTYALEIRAFPVTVEDRRNGAVIREKAILTKEHLKAAQLVGQSSNELIQRMYERAGYRVLEIEKPVRQTIELDLNWLYLSEAKDEN